MTSPGVIELHDVPAPASPGPSEVLLRIRRIGVCGSDVHVNHGKHPYTSYPVVQGHEFSAVIEAVGADVEGLRPGMKVTATPQVTCGTCRPCRRGDYHICDHLRVQGFQAPGCAADMFVTRADRVVPLPESFTFEQGALVEPVAVAVHALSRVPSVRDRNVAVLGGGPIGNLVAQVAQAERARVLVTDVSEHRLDVARQCGIPATSNAALEPLQEAAARAFGDDGFEIAFECAGVQDSIAAAVETLQKGGTLVLVAVYADTPRVNTGFIQDRELTVVGTLMYQYADFVRAVELIASGRVATAPLETKHFTLERYADAYAFIDAARDRTMKVFIDV
jgi:2-desacetyl-2-hydroxyethyl bacteriochlorophyllide A dehydrogenase